MKSSFRFDLFVHLFSFIHFFSNEFLLTDIFEQCFLFCVVYLSEIGSTKTTGVLKISQAFDVQSRKLL